MAGSGMYAYDPQRGTFGGGSLAPGTGTVVEARNKKKQAEARKKAEAEAKKKAAAEPATAPAAPLGPVTAAPAPDPVATLPDTSYGTQITGDAIAEFGGLPELAGEKKEKERIATRKEEQKNLGLLFKGRGGQPYSFPEPTGPQKVTEVVPVGAEADTGKGHKFPMSEAQFNSLSTQEQMDADMELAKLGADRSKMILPTQADVNLYQSREGKLLEGGAPEYRLNLGDKPRNYVDSARPNEGRWIDPQTGDQYNVNEYSGRQLRQRMPHLVRPEEMDRMIGEGMAPEFMGAKSSRVDVKTGDPRSPDEGYEGLEGPELDAYKAARERLQKQGDRWKSKEGAVEQLDEEAKTAAVMPPVDPREAPLGVDPVTGDPILPEPRVGSRPLGVLAAEHAASIPPETVIQYQQEPADLARAGMAPDPAKFFGAQPVEDTGEGFDPVMLDDETIAAAAARVFGDVPDAAEVYEDPRLGEEAAAPPSRVPRAEEDAPEVDIPVDDDEVDEGLDVEMDPEDVAAFVEASENPLDPATAAYEALDDGEDIVAQAFEEAVEAGLAQPVATPELSDVDLAPFVEAIFGKGAEATPEVIARVRKILAEHKGKTPAQIKAIFELRDPLQ